MTAVVEIRDHIEPLVAEWERLARHTKASSPCFLAANETEAERLSHALLCQNPRRIDLSFLVPTDAGVSLRRAAADAARYRVIAESVRAAPYVAVDGTWDACLSGPRTIYTEAAQRAAALGRRLLKSGHATAARARLGR